MFLKDRFFNRALARSRAQETRFVKIRMEFIRRLSSLTRRFTCFWYGSRIERASIEVSGAQSPVIRAYDGVRVPSAFSFLLHPELQVYSRCTWSIWIILNIIVVFLLFSKVWQGLRLFSKIFSKTCIPKKENAWFCFSYLFNKQQIYFRYNLVVRISDNLQNNWSEFCEVMRIISLQGFIAWNVTLYFVHLRISGVHLKQLIQKRFINFIIFGCFCIKFECLDLIKQ